MANLYKLTDSCGKTHNGTQWGPGISHSGTGEGGLCGPGWIHAYEHPLVAVLMNPIHADFKNPRLWEAEAEGEVGLRDGQLKCGCRTLTTIREIPLPAVTTEMRVRFAILCAKEVCASYSAWNAWADKWLSGEDRTQAAAAEAARAAVRAWAAWAYERAASASAARAYERAEAAWAAAAASARAAARASAAWAVAWAWARAAAWAWAAEAAAAAEAAWAAAEAAAEAAEAAAEAAEMDVGHRIDFFGIAEKACHSGLT